MTPKQRRDVQCVPSGVRGPVVCPEGALGLGVEDLSGNPVLGLRRGLRKPRSLRFLSSPVRDSSPRRRRPGGRDCACGLHDSVTSPGCPRPGAGVEVWYGGHVPVLEGSDSRATQGLPTFGVSRGFLGCKRGWTCKIRVQILVSKVLLRPVGGGWDGVGRDVPIDVRPGSGGSESRWPCVQVRERKRVPGVTETVLRRGCPTQ